jgi:hypothetical protein
VSLRAGDGLRCFRGAVVVAAASTRGGAGAGVTKGSTATGVAGAGTGGLLGLRKRLAVQPRPTAPMKLAAHITR